MRRSQACICSSAWISSSAATHSRAVGRFELCRSQHDTASEARRRHDAGSGLRCGAGAPSGNDRARKNRGGADSDEVSVSRGVKVA